MKSFPEMTPALFDRVRRDYDVVPIVAELSADTITPVSVFSAISDLSSESFLFESVERGEKLGRFSFIGFSPRKTMTFDRKTNDPVEKLRRELVPLKVFGEELLPPFFGGAVGYFGFGVSGWTERLPDSHPTASYPEAKLLFFDNVIAFDHLKQKLYVCANVFTSDPRPSAVLVKVARQRVDDTITILESARPDLIPMESTVVDDGFMTGSMNRATFEQMVLRAKEQIAAGEIFQIVLSQSWSAPFDEAGALSLYRALRSVNPSPYMFLLRTSECTLVGTSPEMLVRVTRGEVETHPIAGTRPRGADEEEDARLQRDLLDDPKERAEHLMLVDLGRNDVGRVSTSGSVKVRSYAHVERYSHVMHIVSNVVGQLRPDRTPIDAFLSCFPAGTVSGAPKIRAMELIDELEPARRGAYAGAVVYVGFSGNLDSCIAIRTVILADGKATIQAGAGIVHDSEPSREYDETVSKAAALRKAVAIARTRSAAPQAAVGRGR